MILAHHAGEELIPGLVAAATGALPVLLVVTRERLRRVGRRFRRRAG